MGNLVLTNDIDLPKVRAERSWEAIMASKVLFIKRLDLQSFLGGQVQY